MNYRVINHEQKSIHLNITAHLSGLAVEAVFLDPLTLFSLFLSLILLSLHVHKASVCVCARARMCEVHGSEHLGILGLSSRFLADLFPPRRALEIFLNKQSLIFQSARKRPLTCSVRMAKADGSQLWVRWWGWRTDFFSSSSSSCSVSSDKPMDLKQGDKESILKPFALVTAKPKQERRQQTTTPASAVNSTSDTTFHASWEESYDSLSLVLNSWKG